MLTFTRLSYNSTVNVIGIIKIMAPKCPSTGAFQLGKEVSTRNIVADAMTAEFKILKKPNRIGRLSICANARLTPRYVWPIPAMIGTQIHAIGKPVKSLIRSRNINAETSVIAVAIALAIRQLKTNAERSIDFSTCALRIDFETIKPTNGTNMFSMTV